MHVVQDHPKAGMAPGYRLRADGLLREPAPASQGRAARRLVQGRGLERPVRRSGLVGYTASLSQCESTQMRIAPTGRAEESGRLARADSSMLTRASSIRDTWEP